MRRARPWLLCLALLGGLLWAAAGRAEDPLREAARSAPRAVFMEAVEAYRAGDMEGAVERFEVLAARYDSPEAHYNLGNALYQQGRMGRAVAAWRRALRLDPMAEDAAHNLEVVTGRSPYGQGPAGLLRRVYLAVTLDTLEGLSLGLLGLAILGYGLLRHTGSALGRVVTVLALSLSLMVGGWAQARAARWLIGREAVIVGGEPVTATAGPGELADFPRVFTAHPGQLVQIHRTSGPYRQVTLETGAAGWVPAASLEEI